jgi:predicted nucleic acid-binding protein
MTVTDAGVWIRALVDEEPGGRVRKRLMAHASVASPALIDLEFTNVLRGLVTKKSINVRQANRALTEFIQAPIQRYAHLALLDRIWRLRANLTDWLAIRVGARQEASAPARREASGQ